MKCRPSAVSSTFVEQSHGSSSAMMTEIWRMLDSSSAYIKGFGGTMFAAVSGMQDEDKEEEAYLEVDHENMNMNMEKLAKSG
jgi:hypothetical protein